MRLVSFLFFLLLPTYSWALFGIGGGLILMNEDKRAKSNLLSSDRRCTEFPSHFIAAHVQNTGSSHCALWTDANCKGRLYVVPAHYTMRLPAENFKSLIC
ncbi:hypothetical protein BDF20DRAFT_890123 [Mycotypha africana]|uniref:uncharacterized protein n=1 Tax=Mycotypha africana TaxID=64632 RepID=UPI0023016CE2|nr:uncharacterized protein BDF20DRAFT_890123 [Mycotypha africana]KAI8970250.1 hypothetical protein BDF20DRAFT_890123 [Mycotypha africana]